mmetsp:Transcript_27632/g.43746  ORF Transcript_27632/g.43746 Transcript_27632/m.43746 type:complete len:220 (+) Transcript_27632:340-999(+)
MLAIYSQQQIQPAHHIFFDSKARFKRNKLWDFSLSVFPVFQQFLIRIFLQTNVILFPLAFSKTLHKQNTISIIGYSRDELGRLFILLPNFTRSATPQFLCRHQIRLTRKHNHQFAKILLVEFMSDCKVRAVVIFLIINRNTECPANAVFDYQVAMIFNFGLLVFDTLRCTLFRILVRRHIDFGVCHLWTFSSSSRRSPLFDSILVVVVLCRVDFQCFSG